MSPVPAALRCRAGVRWVPAPAGMRLPRLARDDAARQALTGHGVPELAAEQIVRAFAMLRQGAGSKVTPTARALTGAAPRDFAAFARDHARLFAPVPIAATGGKR